MSTANELEQFMLELINEDRAEAGLDPLKMEQNLNASSENHSQWMLNQDQFSHTGAGGSSAGDRIENAGFDLSGSWSLGENIALQSERGAPGLADDVRDLHESLMQSPGHRANILSDDFEFIGIGLERGDFDGFDAVVVTQNFGRTDGTVELDQGAPSQPASQPATETVAETSMSQAPDWQTVEIETFLQEWWG